MWFRGIFRRRDSTTLPEEGEALADVAFLRRLDRLSLHTSRFLRGEATGQRPSWRRLPASDFREHRLYLPGDDLRHVDWNASARAEHVFVKLGERPKEASVHLLLDTSLSMNWGRPSKLWAARRLAAALGHIALSHGDWLVIQALGEIGQPFGPSQGKGRLPAMLRFLRDLPIGSRVDLEAAVRRHVARQSVGGFAIILSDLLGTPDLGAVLAHFPLPRWQLLILHLLHPAELDPAWRGEVELRDAETGECANYDLDEQTVTQYRAFVRGWCERVEQTCFDGTAAYARSMADWPIEKAVMPYLMRRGVLEPA